jgi:hypothetical protein
MKPNCSTNHRKLLWCASLACLLGAAPDLFGAPQKTATPTVATNAAPDIEDGFPKSEFDERAGKDPFFPNRVLVPVAKAPSPKAADTSRLLQLKGFSGAVNRRLAIINNQTFEVGEEREVTTSGGKIKIRCVEIGDDSVLVELPNQGGRKELQLRGGVN